MRKQPAIPFDLKRVIMDDTWIAELVETKTTLYEVPVPEGVLHMEGGWLMLNALLWKPIIRRGMPIREVYRYYGEEFTASVQKRIHTAMYQDILKLFPGTMVEVQEEMVSSINDMYNAVCIYMGSYQRTIDIFGLVETMEYPPIAAACYTGIDATNRNINVSEHKLKICAEHLIKVLSDPKHRKKNSLYPFVRMGAVSKQQLPQVMMAAGTRTDVNDVMIYRPIVTSYVRGLRGIIDFAIDSLAAKKSLMYNKSSLRESRYEDRKQQLLSSIQYRIHPDDCGSQVTIPFMITESNHRPCVGKYIVEQGQLVELTFDNLPSYIGKEVHLRSPITCRHTDGCCHVCGGRMIDYMLPDTIVGIASTIELMGPTAQLILSNKHFSTTTSLSYIQPSAYSGILEVRRNDIGFEESLNLKKAVIGVPFSNAARISDLQYIESGDAINDQHFSTVELMSLANENGEIIVPPTPMTDINGATPYFSTDMLRYIKDNPDMLTETEGMIWISLKKFDISKTVLSCIVVNASMVRFAKQIRGLFSKTITEYTSLPAVLCDFTSIVYEKLHTNLFHLEIIVRSSMITSEDDVGIPVVDDIYNVKFGTLRALMPLRSIGAQLAYQEMNRYLENPCTFTVPKPPGPFDALAGML